MNCDYLKILNLIKAGEWESSHKAVQDCSDEMSCLIHAYLHRVEGDLENAEYWYRRTGEVPLSNSLEEELSRLYEMVGGT
jgi:hypothetical protein